ncbi:MAG TPA: DUF4352 domain-containing protein [Propionibacteriaceae bacterium]
MDEVREDEPAGGMGPSPSGPAFVPWHQAQQASGADVPLRIDPHRPQLPPVTRPGTRRAAVVTAIAVAVVGIVVAAASVVAYYGDTHVSAPQPVAQRPAPAQAPSRTDRIDFVTPDGAGQLVMLSWSWSEGSGTSTSGSYLRVELELVCSDGTVGYDPYNFQAFDRDGRLYEMASEGVDAPVLPVGDLHSGQTVRGTIAFDMPRGETTLLMSDGTDQTVTAIRVPD